MPRLGMPKLKQISSACLIAKTLPDTTDLPGVKPWFTLARLQIASPGALYAVGFWKGFDPGGAGAQSGNKIAWMKIILSRVKI